MFVYYYVCGVDVNTGGMSLLMINLVESSMVVTAISLSVLLQYIYK